MKYIHLSSALDKIAQEINQLNIFDYNINDVFDYYFLYDSIDRFKGKIFFLSEQHVREFTFNEFKYDVFRGYPIVYSKRKNKALKYIIFINLFPHIDKEICVINTFLHEILHLNPSKPCGFRKYHNDETDRYHGGNEHQFIIDEVKLKLGLKGCFITSKNYVEENRMIQRNLYLKIIHDKLFISNIELIEELHSFKRDKIILPH